MKTITIKNTLSQIKEHEKKQNQDLYESMVYTEKDLDDPALFVNLCNKYKENVRHIEKPLIINIPYREVA